MPGFSRLPWPLIVCVGMRCPCLKITQSNPASTSICNGKKKYECTTSLLSFHLLRYTPFLHSCSSPLVWGGWVRLISAHQTSSGSHQGKRVFSRSLVYDRHHSSSTFKFMQLCLMRNYLNISVILPLGICSLSVPLSVFPISIRIMLLSLRDYWPVRNAINWLGGNTLTTDGGDENN